LQKLNPCFAFRLNTFNAIVVIDGCPALQSFVKNLSALQMELAEMQEDLV